jgi:hypothetical protein
MQFRMRQRPISGVTSSSGANTDYPPIRPRAQFFSGSATLIEIQTIVRRRGMKLTPIFSYHADLKPPQQIGRAQFGNRLIFDVTGGTLSGPGIKGTILPSGGDWILIDDKGVGRLDVRVTIETDDGALIYMQYFGLIVLGDTTAPETQFGERYFMTQPRFETSSAKYDWLNRIVAVAEGRSLPNAVEYNVYRADN